LALPASRRATFAALPTALAAGDIDLSVGCDWPRARDRLGALPGIGPWSVEMIAMRGLGDPDAFVPSDLGVRAAARYLGLPAAPVALTRRAALWRPWRSYAVQYLWATGDHAINRLPSGQPAPLAERQRKPERGVPAGSRRPPGPTSKRGARTVRRARRRAVRGGGGPAGGLFRRHADQLRRAAGVARLRICPAGLDRAAVHPLRHDHLLRRAC